MKLLYKTAFNFDESIAYICICLMTVACEQPHQACMIKLSQQILESSNSSSIKIKETL